MFNYKLIRLAYKHGRAFGYRYVFENPDFTKNELLDAIRVSILKKDVFKGLDRIAEAQAREAADHVMHVHFIGKIPEVIKSPQGQFPAI